MRIIEFKSTHQETLRGVLHEPMSAPPYPALIFAHGLLSEHREFGDYPEKFCARGYLVLTFDFRGHGASEGTRGLIAEDRCVEDLIHALDFIEAHPGIDNNRIALFGHSFGGGASLCATARDPRVSAVIAGATIGRLRDEIAPGEMRVYRAAMAFNEWQKRFTHKPLYLPYRVTYKDLFADARARINAERQGFLQRAICADSIAHLLKQDALRCARNLRVPALIVQSELDRVVKFSSTRQVFDAIPGAKEWHQVEGAGHSFATDAGNARTFDFIAAWLDRNLSRQSTVISDC